MPPSPATARVQSPICVVAATTFGPVWPSDRPPPQPATTRASSAAAPASAARRRAIGALARHATVAANSAPPSTAIVGPGGVFSSTESQRPAIPWTAASATDAACQTGRRCVQRRTVAAGTTNSAVASSAPIAVSEAMTAKATSVEQQRIGQARAQAERARGARVEPPGEPAWPEHERRRDRGRARQGGEDEVARARQQQASEEQRVDVAARVEHVARQHHAARERRDESERREAVVARARAARETLHAEREDERRGERAEWRGEAEAVGQHEAREGRGADRVRVEREPAHHDPRAEQAGRRREQQHLEHAALHEHEVEGLEHGVNLIDTHSHYKHHEPARRWRPGPANGMLGRRGEGRAPSAGRAEPTLARPVAGAGTFFPPGHADDGHAGEEAA